MEGPLNVRFSKWPLVALINVMILSNAMKMNLLFATYDLLTYLVFGMALVQNRAKQTSLRNYQLKNHI